MIRVGQDEFGGGIFRSPVGPRGSVYDAVDALVDEERRIFKRGGTLYNSSSNAGSPLDAIADVFVGGGQRTMFWSTAADQTWVLGADDSTIVNIRSGVVTAPALARHAGVAGMAIWPQNQGAKLTFYGGGRNTNYNAGTVSVTNGSRTVTGVGTSWSGRVDAGQLVNVTGNARYGVVQSVDSNTQITLRDPWRGATSAGSTYSIASLAALQPVPFGTSLPPLGSPVYVASVGSPARLVVVQGSRAYFSTAGDPFEFSATGFHELPAAAKLLGADAIRDTLILPTSEGVWTVGNMNFDATDDAGNVQHTVEQINKDVILWDSLGMAGWGGSMVIPALDDVVLMGVDGQAVPISEGIRPLYRSYVKGGHRPGIAAVHRNHYLLPVVDGSGALVDQLVCRLDQRDWRGRQQPAWTRWQGHAASVALARRTSGASSKLLGVDGARVVNLTGCFDPVAANKTDANGGQPVFDVITNDLQTGRGNLNTVISTRLHYLLTDAGGDNPSLTVSYSTGEEGTAFTALAGSAPEADGSAPEVWWKTIRTRRVRFRVTLSGPAANLRLRGLEIHVRPSHRL